MKRHLLTSFFFLLLTLTVLAQNAAYYKAANGKMKAELKAALKGIIANHTKITYDNLWAAYEKVDYIENKTNSSGQYKVFDYYSNETFYFNGNGKAVSGMNKEHVAPQSWWGGGTNINVGCDLIQVLPSEAKANSAKSNYPLGVVTGSVSFTNARIKTGKGSNGKMVFEPCDEYKGDFARIYFYVATCYPDVEWESFSDIEVAFTKQDYPTLKADFVNLLLQWHRQDPVCEWEQTRNNRAYKVQKNRNPFIDYPELAEYIWGTKVNEVFKLDGSDDGTGGDAHNETLPPTIFDFGSNNWGFPVGAANKTDMAANYTNNDQTITVAGSSGEGYYWHTGGYLIMGKNGAYLTLPAFENAVDSIKVFGHAGASYQVVQNIYVGNQAVSTATTGAATQKTDNADSEAITNTYIINPAYQAAGNRYTLKITSRHNTQIAQITVYFKPITIEQQQPVFDFAYEATTDFGQPYSLSEDDITGGPVQLTVTPAEAATVSGLTITPGYAGELHATVTTSETKYYSAGTDDFTLTVSQPAPIGGGKANTQTMSMFEEHFSSFTSGTGGRDGAFTGSVANSAFSANDNWSSTSKIFIAKESVKMGTSAENGVLQSVPIDLTGNATLTFSAAGWGSGTNSLTVTATGGNLSGDTDITLTNGQWSDYVVSITGATGSVVLTFTGKRGFIDDIVLEGEVQPSDFAAEPVQLDTDGFATYASDYTLDLTHNDGFTAWKAVEIRGKWLVMHPVTGIVPAGTPLIFKGEANAQLNIPTTNDMPTDNHADNLLCATLAPTVVWQNEYMGLDGNHFQVITDQYAVLEANQAILDTDLMDADAESDSLTFVFSSANTIAGDVNSDGAVTIADVTALVNIILGKTIGGTPDLAIADVNHDGTVTIADVTALVNMILGKKASIPHHASQLIDTQRNPGEGTVRKW
ncbi:MAG: endonuclease [Bacteroidaceae bacterium]|nr:endonuclease [Bacteroidaceae bacterium]